MISIKGEAIYLISLLVCAIKNDIPKNPPENINFYNLLSLARCHSVSNMAYYSVKKIKKFFPEDIYLEFEADYKKALAIEAMQFLEEKKIADLFEKAGVDALFYSGCKIKNMYRKSDMRLMADIDILIKDEDAKKVKSIMSDAGYVLTKSDKDHDVYSIKPYLIIEIHKNYLLDKNKDLFDYYVDIWDRLVLSGDSKHIYKLSLEDEYILLLFNFLDYYNNKGIGIKHALDIRVFLDYSNSLVDKGKIDEVTRKFHLKDFENRMLKLLRVWFDNEENTHLTEEMTRYIAQSGFYSLIKKDKKPSKNKSFIGKIQIFFKKTKKST